MTKSSTENRLKFLSSTPFFSEVSEKTLKEIAKKTENIIYAKGKEIVKIGDLGDSMFIIVDGKVKIHEGDYEYGELGKGDCFGEYSLIDNKVRSASVTALEESNILIFRQNDFQDLLSEDVGFANGILKVMTKRLRSLDTIQENLATSKQELLLANSKMKGLIEGAMDSIIMFDSNFRIILTNSSANNLLENDDVLQRNILFFFDEASASLIESIVKEKILKSNFLPNVVKVIGSNEKETLNEGSLSIYGDLESPFFTLILRNIEDRLEATDKINLLTNQTQYLEDEIKELTTGYGIIAEDESMKEVLNLINQVAKTNATVLINGETGTGKELVARAIHNESDRNNKPLIRINCGAIPANLIESELFGHKKGAFTGATSDRKGRFLLADKGTLFLDEIGELPLELQPKLLRIIQEGEFEPVGSSETIMVDVRIIAATHRDLLKFSSEGKFREDLFYRLNVFPINVPSLRDRGNDVSLIAEEMIKQFSKKLNKSVEELSANDKSILTSYHWPGNVRELQNLIERSIIITQNGQIDWSVIIPRNSSVFLDKIQVKEKILTSKELLTLEKENILKALKKTRWKISGKNGAAELLQLPPTTLSSRIKALGIERPI